MRTRAVSATLLALLLAGCGSDSGSDPAPSVSTISVAATSTDPLVSIGETRALTATARDANGATVASPSLTWSSSAPSVATVSGTGNSATVTAVGNGSATITAASGSVQGTAQVTVAQRVTSLAITGVPASLVPGATAQAVAQGRDARGGTVAGATGFTYASSDQGVAVIGANGAITAIAPGNASITGTLVVNGANVTGSAPLAVGFATAGANSAAVNANDQSQFTPGNVTITPGGTVTWTFGTVVHNVNFSGTGAPQSIGNSASTSVSRTFPTAGTFNYTCSLHAGMSGTVVVQGSSNAPTYTALLNGANERPNPANTQGSGSAALTVNGSTVSYVVTFSRLTGPPTMAHIHGPGNASQAVGVLVDFPTTGQTANAGVLTGTFTAANIRGQGGQPPISLDSLFTLLRTSNAYVNVHTAQFPGGEIRGQTVPR